MLWVSLRTVGIAMALSVVLGMAAAWLLVNRQFPGRRELGALATAALALPAPVICYTFLSGRAPLLSPGYTAAAFLSAAPLLVRAMRTALAGLNPVYGN